MYSPNSVPMPFPDVEMTDNIPETEEVAFILVTNKKYKRKSKVSSLLSMFSLDSSHFKGFSSF